MLKIYIFSNKQNWVENKKLNALDSLWTKLSLKYKI